MCDNKGKTICLFLNGKGNIFGGYSSISWTSNSDAKTDGDCFLFTLTNIYNTEPIKFTYSQNMSVYHDLKYGPVFGKVSNLCCGSNFMDKKSNKANFPNSYKDVLGKGKSIFTGDFDNQKSSFTLKELEVFEIF